MTALVALLFKLVGTGFLAVATIGVLRFEDSFQRMHAATKAGTLGAGLVLLGVIITKGSLDATIVALLTLVFLIGTMPVAGHLLGRAAYISGAPLRAREDALAGILPRAAHSLEQRTVSAFLAGNAPVLDRRPAQGRIAAPTTPEPRALVQDDLPYEDIPYDAGYDGVRFALIAPHARMVTRRAMRLAGAKGTGLTAVAVIDRDCIDTARVPAARDVIRAKLAQAIEEMRAEMGGCPSRFALIYEEGDPLKLIPASSNENRELLVLPTDGWCHHGARVTLPVFEERMTDKLFEVAEKHMGPTLFVGFREGEGKRLVVMHDGSRRVQRLAAWAIGTGLWPVSLVTLVGGADASQREALQAVAADRGVRVEHVARARASGGTMLPRAYAGAAALVLPRLPQRAIGYGDFWYDNLAPGWRGDVLV